MAYTTLAEVRAAILIIAALLVGCGWQVRAFYGDPFRQASVPQWHHGEFQDISESVRSEVHHLLHSRAQVPFQVPLEVNIVLVGFNEDGGYRYHLDAKKFGEVLKKTFPTHRPSCLETAQQLHFEHKIFYNVIPVGQPELIALEKDLRNAMKRAEMARKSEFGQEVPLYEIEATSVEPSFQKLYTFLFGFGADTNLATEMNSPVPNAIFILNFDKVRMDPRNSSEVDLEKMATSKIETLTLGQLKQQEGDYIYRYRYNGGASSQLWLSSGRYTVIDLSAGPCTYGRVDSDEGSVGYRSIPRLQDFVLRGDLVIAKETENTFAGQLSALVASAIEHAISPDVRFERVDSAERLLVSIIVLSNHHYYNLFQAGYNFTIDMQQIESEVKKMVQPGQEVVVVGGIHNLHDHEKLSIAVAKAMRGKSIHETQKDGRFHARTTTYLDGAILREEMRHSADFLASGLLEVADPALSSKFFYRQDSESQREKDSPDPLIKSRPAGAYYMYSSQKDKRSKSRREKFSSVWKSYGTRVIPVFVLSLAGIEKDLLMEDENLLWFSYDAIIVLQHASQPIPLSFVSETKRLEALPNSPQRHIIAGLASVVAGLVAPYERASHVHQRPLVNWLWSCGHHPFGHFSNTSGLSQSLLDTALRNSIYARVDQALRTIRASTESVQSFANKYLRTPLGDAMIHKNKSSAELWIDKFYKKTTNLPEPFPHEVVEQLETYLDELEKKLVDLSALLYDHHLRDAHFNASSILQYTRFTEAYVNHVLQTEKEHMRCCRVEYAAPAQSSQAFMYGGILVAGFLVYFLVICFPSSER
ncbi:hypothetical protein O6H91_02G086100 [Diphasiastrum complanatum]|uniref:Uncharacterized protein n=1 Tax=Diphasiastrum complanatum TaxID=34168 RepID=A0ACC2EI62_DIPCM|nr:hypothetical protein O6H91_02G086100 [Diphasiastrum complanatum]